MIVGYEIGARVKTYVALLRGINVGGNNVLPMKDLIAMLEDTGARNVETYIQSGNAVFQSEEEDTSVLSGRIGAAIKKGHGFEPEVLVLESEELGWAVRSNPFPEAESEPKTLLVYFLASTPRHSNFGALRGIKSERERFVLKEGVFYLHAPDGIGRSKLAANAEKLLGVSMTGRNWRTVCKITTMTGRCG